MKWAAFLLTLVGFYAGVKCLGFTKRNDSLKFLGLTLATFLFALTQLSIVVESWLDTYNLTLYPAVIVEWGHVLSLSFVLSAMAIFIRQSKPVFAQFPIFYAALPLLIVFSYFLVKDTYALKEWLISLYQGGAILVALLMYSVYAYRERKYAIILVGTLFFLFTFLLFWFVPGIRENYSWLWKLIFSVSIIITIYGYDYVQQRSDELQSLQKNPI